MFDDADIEKAVEGAFTNLSTPQTQLSDIRYRCHRFQIPRLRPNMRLRQQDLRPILRIRGICLPARGKSISVQNRQRARRTDVSTRAPRSFSHRPLNKPSYRTHGPLIHARAVEKVEKHISDAVSKGAQILVGGKRPEGMQGSFYLPTILADVPTNALLNTEETFGPVAALIKFETEDEVLKLANESDVGLAGYFYSRDVGRVWRVAEKLEVGMVGTNTGLISQAVIPFGGIKESGIGKFCLLLNFNMNRLLIAVLCARLRRRARDHGIHEQ